MLESVQNNTLATHTPGKFKCPDLLFPSWSPDECLLYSVLIQIKNREKGTVLHALDSVDISNWVEKSHVDFLKRNPQYARTIRVVWTAWPLKRQAATDLACMNKKALSQFPIIVLTLSRENCDNADIQQDNTDGGMRLPNDIDELLPNVVSGIPYLEKNVSFSLKYIVVDKELDKRKFTQIDFFPETYEYLYFCSDIQALTSALDSKTARLVFDTDKSMIAAIGNYRKEVTQSYSSHGVDEQQHWNVFRKKQ